MYSPIKSNILSYRMCNGNRGYLVEVTIIRVLKREWTVPSIIKSYFNLFFWKLVLNTLRYVCLEPQIIKKKATNICTFLYLNQFDNFTDSEDSKGSCDLSRLISSVNYVIVNFLDHFPFQAQHNSQKHFKTEGFFILSHYI